MKTYQEHDCQSNIALAMASLKFICRTSKEDPAFVDHVYEMAIHSDDDYYNVQYSVFPNGRYNERQCVRSAFQQLELNEKLVRVNRENYTAIRVWLN